MKIRYYYNMKIIRDCCRRLFQIILFAKAKERQIGFFAFYSEVFEKS